MTPVAAPSDHPPAPRAGRPARLRGALAALAVGGVLAATFALYLRPGLMLDLGQLMAFCGFR
jgi:hypothetical protein